MNNTLISSMKSNFSEQQETEKIVFEIIQQKLGFDLVSVPKLYVSDSIYTYMQPDFYCEKQRIIGEIFSHIGKPKKAQGNKIANDILKMLLWEKRQHCKYRKIIVVCDDSELKKLTGKSVLAESIREFGIEIIQVELNHLQRDNIIKAQLRQKMINA